MLIIVHILFFQESEQNQAEKYGQLALKADRYNPSALVNMGNLFFQRRDYEKARQHYQDALNNDSSCVEALYNLGLFSLSIQFFYNYYIGQMVLLSCFPNSFKAGDIFICS